jgi:NTE family protein
VAFAGLSAFNQGLFIVHIIHKRGEICMIFNMDRYSRMRRRRPVVGVALSGGGIRGAAHIGALQALCENNIPIDLISGTSAGAIVAAFYASGYSPRQMRNFLEKITFQELIDLKITTSDLFKHGCKWILSGKFQFWSVLPTGLIKGEKIEEFLKNFLQQRTVRNTKIPVAITAVDVNTADTVFFMSPALRARGILNARFYHNAFLYEAVRASISIPGIFYPKKYRNMTLVDGAVKNNLPTDILKEMGADIIIAIDLGYAGQHNYDLATVGEVLVQCLEIMSREVTLLKSEQYADIIIRPQTADINYKNTGQLLTCICRGEQAATAKISEIKKLLY